MDLLPDEVILYIMTDFLDIKYINRFRGISRRYRFIVDFYDILNIKLSTLPWSITFHVNERNFMSPCRFGDGILLLGEKQSKLIPCEFCKVGSCETIDVNGTGFSKELIETDTCSAILHKHRRQVDFYEYRSSIQVKAGQIPAVCDISYKGKRFKR